MPREINKVLLFREDISPFLVHLTKDTVFDGRSICAKENLLNILSHLRLDPGSCLLDAHHGYDCRALNPDEQKEFFNAICFTETPINEIHCLLEIGGSMNLKPYGIVFLKETLRNKNVSPVFYINNYNANNDDIFYELCKMIQTCPSVAKKTLPLIALWGKKVIGPGFTSRYDELPVDFLWEREWRRPRVYGNMSFDPNDVFIGLCPHEEIDEFESRINWLKFIDPKRNMKWYADKLIDARQRLDLKFSVV